MEFRTVSHIVPQDVEGRGQEFLLQSLKKVKVKVILKQAMKAQRGRCGIVLLFL